MQGQGWMIQVRINGEYRQFDAAISVAWLVESMSLQGRRIAVERNGVIVPRSQYADQLLADSDQLEIVVAVGGG